jgi:hypothetical protein
MRNAPRVAVLACAVFACGCGGNVVVDGAKGNGGGGGATTTTTTTTSSGTTTETPMCQHCTALACFDVNFDPMNCGGCGNICPSETYCNLGTCTPACVGTLSCESCCGSMCCAAEEICCAGANGPECVTPVNDTCPAAANNCHCH